MHQPDLSQASGVPILYDSAQQNANLNRTKLLKFKAAYSYVRIYSKTMVLELVSDPTGAALELRDLKRAKVKCLLIFY